MEEKSALSADESLLLIRSMIDKAKTDFRAHPFYFLFWGWVIFICLIAEYILGKVVGYPIASYVWFSIYAAAIITVIYARRHAAKRRRKTYVEESMGQVMLGVGISFFVLTVIFYRTGFAHAYPVYTMLYGLVAFLTGRILKFKPLFWAGILTWILAIISSWFEYDLQILFAAAGILVSYLIPGYLLKSERSVA